MDEMWNEYHENVLRQWGEASACYRYMHHRAFLMYKQLSLRFSLPVIVLSTITGTANFAQSSFPESIQGGVPAVIGGMNLIAGLIATIMQFLKINELMENHRQVLWVMVGFLGIFASSWLFPVRSVVKRVSFL